MTRTARSAILITALLAVPAAALAETGGSGFLPKGEEPPGAYREILDEPNGLRLLRPPAVLPHNRDGEAGSMRFYAGVRFLKASRREGVVWVRAALLRTYGEHRLLSHLKIRRTAGSGWRHVFLDRLGAFSDPDGAGAGQDYVIRYTVKLRNGRTIGRSFRVEVPKAG